MSKHLKAVQGIREQIARKVRDAAALRTASPSKSEALQALRARLDADELTMARRIEYGDPSRYLDALLSIDGKRAELGPLLAVLIGTDRIIAALTKHLTAMPGPDAAERAALADTLDAEVFALGVEEELQIVAAERLGERIARRGDADPRAVLAV